MNGINHDVTRIPKAAGAGDRKAAEELIPLVYEELRYFVGLTISETAEVLGIASATVRRGMISAKAWLMRKLDREIGV